MAQYFRMVSNRRFWDKPTGQENRWLTAGLFPADAVTQLRSDRNTLSVYKIESKEQIEKVIAAMAAKRDKNKFYQVDYGLLDDGFVKAVGISISQTEGDTGSSEVNSWHWDLIELDNEKAQAISRHLLEPGKMFRSGAPEVTALLEKYHGLKPV